MTTDWKRLQRIGLIAAAYFIAAKFGLTLAFVHESATAVWPPTGIALAAVLLAGPGVWPGIFLGALAANITTSGSVGSSLIIAIGNTLEPIIGAGLIGRSAHSSGVVRHARDVFRFVAFAGALAPMVAASLGVMSLYVHGLLARSDVAPVWFTWWLGDGLGAVLFTPAILLWGDRDGSAALRAQRRTSEFALLWVSAALSAVLSFGPWLEPSAGELTVKFFCMPIVLWAALRFGQREAVVTTLVIASVAIWSLLNRQHSMDPVVMNEFLLIVQAFLAVLSVTGLVIGALVQDQHRLSAELEQRVVDRTEQLRRTNDSLVQEVRRRQEVEDALRGSEGRLLEAQALAHIGSWEWDIPGNQIWLSDELCRLYGVPIGTTPNYEAFLARVHSDDRVHVHETLSRALDEARPFAFEHRIIRPDGLELTVFGQGRVFVEDAGRPARMQGTAQDISDRKRAEREHGALVREQAARQQAEEANRLKDGFLAMVSHELRTPINAVAGWAHMLAGGLVTPDRVPQVLAVIERNAQTQVRLIDDLLDVSELTTGKVRLEVRRVELGSIVSAAVETVAVAAQAKQIAINVRLEGSIVIRGDAHRLQQVIWNLLSNAVKFTPQGGRVDVTMARSDSAATIVVADSGPGMNPADMAHAFDPLWQLMPDQPHHGLGLGLAIVRALTEAHGGTVNVGVTSGQTGTTFTVRLPLPA